MARFWKTPFRFGNVQQLQNPNVLAFLLRRFALPLGMMPNEVPTGCALVFPSQLGIRPCFLGMRFTQHNPDQTGFHTRRPIYCMQIWT